MASTATAPWERLGPGLGFEVRADILCETGVVALVAGFDPMFVRAYYFLWTEHRYRLSCAACECTFIEGLYFYGCCTMAGLERTFRHGTPRPRATEASRAAEAEAWGHVAGLVDLVRPDREGGDDGPAWNAQAWLEAWLACRACLARHTALLADVDASPLCVFYGENPVTYEPQVVMLEDMERVRRAVAIISDRLTRETPRPEDREPSEFWPSWAHTSTT